jgi:hypothetical protein
MDSSPAKAPSAKAPSKTALSLPQELEELYVSLRGSPYVTSMVEAKKAFQAKDYIETLRIVRNTGELHHRAHFHLLQMDPGKEIKNREDREKIIAKQAKLQGTLALFAEVVQQLEKLARVQPEKPQPPAAPKSKTEAATLVPPPIPEDFRKAFEAAEGDEAQFRIVCEWFHAQAVQDEKYLQLGALYGLRHQGQIHLVRYTKRNAALAMLTLELVFSGKPFKPLPLEKLLEFGARQLFYRLLPKAHSEASDPQNQGEVSAIPLIDMGTFTQLLTAVQSTGLLANYDAIGFVRDNEFRTKKYSEAFDRIEGLFVHLRTAAEQRSQRLRREETDYRSGKSKISTKDWMAKQQRDMAQTQCVNRALRFFAKVLDGLRVMIRHAAEKAPREVSENSNRSNKI